MSWPSVLCCHCHQTDRECHPSLRVPKSSQSEWQHEVRHRRRPCLADPCAAAQRVLFPTVSTVQSAMGPERSEVISDYKERPTGEKMKALAWFG